jgi:hypothetical protein
LSSLFNRYANHYKAWKWKTPYTVKSSHRSTTTI